MTDAEKQELTELVTTAVTRSLTEEQSPCRLGIDTATARELISFAETWKCCRRIMLTGVIAAAVSAVIAAVWSGIKTALRH